MKHNAPAFAGRTIVHITNTDVRNDNRIIKEMTSLHRSLNVDIVAIGIGHGASHEQEDAVWGKAISLSVLGRRLTFLPRAPRYFIELIEFTLRVLFWGLRIKPTYIHCHDTFALPAGWLLQKFSRSKLIYDAHELESQKAGQNRVLSFCTLCIERFTWNSIEALICVSESIAHWYDTNLGAKRTVVVMNSPQIATRAEMPAKLADPDYFRSLYKIHADETAFIYVGALEPGRGISISLNAFVARERKARLIFLGSGSLEGSIRSAMAHCSRIHLHPPVEHSAVTAIVSSADVGLCLLENVSLSDYLSLPNKLFEYVFSGLSVIATDFPEISRIVQKEGFGLCIPITSEAVLAAFDHFDNRTNSSRTIIPPTSLSWDAQAEILISLYEEISR